MASDLAEPHGEKLSGCPLLFETRQRYGSWHHRSRICISPRIQRGQTSTSHIMCNHVQACCLPPSLPIPALTRSAAQCISSVSHQMPFCCRTYGCHLLSILRATALRNDVTRSVLVPLHSCYLVRGTMRSNLPISMARRSWRSLSEDIY